jgi:hypothetical protein
MSPFARLLYRVFRLSILILPLLGLADATSSPFNGLSWTVPGGLKPSVHVHDCPGRCVMYDAREISFTHLNVHEALLMGSTPALERQRAYLQRSNSGDTFKVISDRQDVNGDTTIRLVLLDRQSRLEEVRLLLFLTRGSVNGPVTLPLELSAYHREDLEAAQPLLLALADSLKFDVAAVSKDITAHNAAFAQAAQAISGGYARGERARLYQTTELLIGGGYGLGGMQTSSTVIAKTVAFLPGGIFLRDDPDPDYRTPDLRRAWEGELPARWKAMPGGVQVTLPGGETVLYRRKASSAGGELLSVADQIYAEIPVLSVQDVTGLFSRDNMSVNTQLSTSVIAGVQEGLQLKPGGALEVSESSFSALNNSVLNNSSGSLPNSTGAEVSATSQAASAGRGRWTYHPASYTLTLNLAGGAVRSGPTYTLAFSPAQRRKPDTLWTLLGRLDWYKR